MAALQRVQGTCEDARGGCILLLQRGSSAPGQARARAYLRELRRSVVLRAGGRPLRVALPLVGAMDLDKVQPL